MNQKQNLTRPQRDEHGLTAEEVEQVEQHDHECDTSSHHDDHYEPLEDAHGEVENEAGIMRTQTEDYQYLRQHF